VKLLIELTFILCFDVNEPFDLAVLGVKCFEMFNLIY